MTLNILKSPNDARLYQSFVLQNGLKVLLIHDPQSGLSKASFESSEGDIVTCRPINDDREESDVSSREDGSETCTSSSKDVSCSESEEDVFEHKSEREKQVERKPVKKAAVALSVGVGSFSDPWDFQGVSHFLEHMLFMGSKKYPDENDYDAFLTAHGGSSNAMTEAEATTFYFDVSPEALHDALDRFAQFFTCPLIKKEVMDREVEAVNNEFTSVLQSDACRLQQLKFFTSQRNHPFSKFSWGNKKSLVDDPMQAGLDARERLLDHYRSEYSAERMNLVILGGEALDAMQQWAIEMFSSVPTGRGPCPSFEDAGFPFQGGRLYVIPAVRDDHKLQVTFQLPCLNKYYRKKADEYLSHLVGHEGKGSLLSALKARGWSTELSAGVSDQSTVTWLFDITITLTDSGLHHGFGCGLSCVQLVFEYLSMLRKAGPQTWAYHEMSAISDMKFRFQEEEDAADYVTQLATDMHIYPPEHVLIGPYLYEDFDSNLIEELLGLMSPAAARIDVQTHSFEQCKANLMADTPGKLESVCYKMGSEPWFEIPFVEVQIPDHLLQSMEAAAPSADLALPPQNSYLPSDFTVVGDQSACLEETPAIAYQAAKTRDSPVNIIDALGMAQPLFPEHPDVVIDEPGLRLWHKLGSSFRLPRTNSYWKLVSPFAYDTPRHAALAHLVLKLLEDALCETAYLAEVAGLHYNIWNEGRQGLEFKVDGFSHKLPLLCVFIFKTLAGLRFDGNSFERVREALLRQYRNVNMKGLKHASYMRLMILKDAMWSAEIVEKELENIGQGDVQPFLKSFFSSMHVECLLYGNITQQQAEALSREVRQVLSAAADLPAASTLLDADARLLDRCVQLPRPCSLLHRAPAKNIEEDNSVVEAYSQFCVDTDADRALVDLIDQIILEPVYNVLRTQEQLGYTVHSGMRLTHGILGFCVVVMSGVHGPHFMESRIEAFLTHFGERLPEMKEEEFEKHRAALLSIKLMKDRNMAEESDRHWACIASGRYNFKSREDEIAHIRLITLHQLQDFYGKYIQPSSSARRKLSIHIVSRKHSKELEAPAVDGVQLMNDPLVWKQKASLYPAIVGASTPTAKCAVNRQTRDAA